MEDAIGDITQRHFVGTTATGENEVINWLIADHEINDQLIKIATTLAWSFGLDKDDVLQMLWLKLCTEIHTLRDPQCLKGWCHIIVGNYCRNVYRHQKVEDSYLENYRHEMRESTRRGGRPMVQSTPVPNPEEELLLKEKEIRFAEAVRRVTRSFPPKVVDGWLQEKSPKDIAEETGIPVKTIYGILKRMQKAIVEERERIEYGG